MKVIKQNIINSVKNEFKNIFDSKYELQDILKSFNNAFFIGDFVLEKSLNELDKINKDLAKSKYSSISSVLIEYDIDEVLNFCDELGIKYYKITQIIDDIFNDYPNKQNIKEKYKTLDEKLINALYQETDKHFYNSFYEYDTKCSDDFFSKAYFIANLLEDTKEFKKYLLEEKELSTIQDATDYERELKDKIKQALKDFSEDEINELKKDDFYDDLIFILNVR